MAERQHCKIFRGITLCKLKKKKNGRQTTMQIFRGITLCKYLEE